MTTHTPKKQINVKPNAEYVIKGDSKYFKEKYQTPNPTIRIEGNWKDLTGGSWGNANGNLACMMFGIRAGFENIPYDDAGVLYGKIYQGEVGLGELVHISELQEICAAEHALSTTSGWEEHV